MKKKVKVVGRQGDLIGILDFSGVVDMAVLSKHYFTNTAWLYWTGLVDKNEVEIYENDMVKLYYKGEWVICQVVWNQLGMWSLKWKNGYINNYHLNPSNYEVLS